MLSAVFGPWQAWHLPTRIGATSRTKLTGGRVVSLAARRSSAYDESRKSKRINRDRESLHGLFSWLAWVAGRHYNRQPSIEPGEILRMLTLLSKAADRQRFCDGISRRDFLMVGGSIAGGLDALLAAASRSPARQRALAQVADQYLPAGGPPHQDLWDLKPEAPAEIRGEFKPISTNVPGIQICELLPKLAAMMDKLVVVRSIVDARGPHYAEQCMSPRVDPNSPSLGAWVSRLEGPASSRNPAQSVALLSNQSRPWGEPGGGGFLGAPYAPYGLVSKYDPGHKAETTAGLAPDPGHLVLRDVTLDRLKSRLDLLKTLDRWQESVAASPLQQERDQFIEQAWSILASPKLVEALDISREDPKIVERYGIGNPAYNADSAPRVTENLLVARRLVEAGRASFRSISAAGIGTATTSGKGEEFPLLDNAVSALVQDLHERGLDKDVSVIVWGEFGRTPTINNDAGRDHWPRVNSALLACGGMKTGQVIGATDKHAGEVVDRPVTFGDIHATLLHNLGIDPHLAIPDAQGRLQRPVGAEAHPFAELVG